MKSNKERPDFRIVVLLFAAAVLIVTGGCIGKESTSSVSPVSNDGWGPNQVIEPEDLVKVFSDSDSTKPIVFQVGYQIQYESGHIPGATYTGTASKPEGIEGLKNAAQDIPLDQEVVLYCGCCPWKNCPNVRPAFTAMKDMGFKNVKVLHISNNFQQDWINKGYPVEK